MSNFAIAHDRLHVEQAVKTVSERCHPITVTGGAVALFGAESDVRVRLVEGGEAEFLHRELLAELDGLIVLVEQGHADEGYRPHVTDQDTNQLGQGESRNLDSIALVQMDATSAGTVARYRLLPS
ncbi:MAG TPA: hypothetical protein VFQ74_02620 [Pseudolysinimonas sp.]|nr:hypothetical protein [Pseudolysinimonas sp.]